MPKQPNRCHLANKCEDIVNLQRAEAYFIYYFNCVSFAIRLSGRKVAIKLID